MWDKPAALFVVPQDPRVLDDTVNLDALVPLLRLCDRVHSTPKSSWFPTAYPLRLGTSERNRPKRVSAFQGEYFVERYGSKQAKRTPPIRRMLEMGVPVGAGSDATRVSSYNPYLSLYWLITGKTVGGLRFYPEENRLDREEALSSTRWEAVGSQPKMERKEHSR